MKWKKNAGCMEGNFSNQGVAPREGIDAHLRTYTCIRRWQPSLFARSPPSMIGDHRVFWTPSRWYSIRCHYHDCLSKPRGYCTLTIFLLPFEPSFERNVTLKFTVNHQKIIQFFHFLIPRLINESVTWIAISLLLFYEWEYEKTVRANWSS